MADPRLDRRYELDWRSLDYPIAARLGAEQLSAPRSYTWACDLWLDQGNEGACVGFGYAHELAARPRPVAGLSNAFARERIYWQTQREDPWPGGDYPGASPRYEGTSVLTGAKVVQELGFYDGYRWALTVEELVSGIGYTGPAVLGLNWHAGMFEPDDSGVIHATGPVEGGHCIAAIGTRITWKGDDRTWATVDRARSSVLLHNSWGASWGMSGRARLSLVDLAQLLAAEGEACFPARTAKLAV